MSGRRAGRELATDPLALQALYYVVSGVWPLLHLRSFMALTGPKADTWLVQTFGALVAALGATFMSASSAGERRAFERAGVATALTLAAADVWFVLRRRISPIYLADAALEVAFAAATHHRRRRN